MSRPVYARTLRREAANAQVVEHIKAKLLKDGWCYDPDNKMWNSPFGSKFKEFEANKQVDIRVLANINNIHKAKTRQDKTESRIKHLLDKGWSSKEVPGWTIWSRELNGSVFRKSTFEQAYKAQRRLDAKGL